MWIDFIKGRLRKYHFRATVFMTYADAIKKLPQASECLMSTPDYWLDTSAGYGT